ncbi:MAG: hypothetical protein P8016_12895 [Sedimentisphaerales bacterium]
MTKHLQPKRSGFVLSMAMIAVIVLLILGATLLEIGFNARLFAIRNTEQIKAQCAADSGMAKAICEMNQRLQEQSWDEYLLPRTLNETILNSEAAFTCTITGDFRSGCSVESRGTCGPSAKTVCASLRIHGPFDYAIAVQQNVVMKPGSVIDGYNFASPQEKLKVVTASILPMQIILAQSTFLDGDVAVGVGGDPEAVICGPDATITGDKYPLTNDIEFPSVSVPQWLLNLPAQRVVGDSMTIAYSSNYDGISLARGQVVTIDGPVTLYVSGNIDIGNSAQIQINKDNPEASLTIFLGGNINCKNGGTINNLTEDPTRLKVFGLDSCTQLSVATAGSFYGGIYAPNATLNLKSSVELYGAFSVKQFLQGGSANVHYDAALKNANLGDPGAKFRIKRWSE